MADDYADMISADLGGRVDLVVGESYGGMIAQYLAARRGGSCGHVAIVVAAAEVSDAGREVDARISSALSRGDKVGVGMAFAEYVLPGQRSRWARRLVGPWIARSLLSGKNYPPGDLLVEVNAEISSTLGKRFPASRCPSFFSAVTATGSIPRTSSTRPSG